MRHNQVKKIIFMCGNLSFPQSFCQFPPWWSIGKMLVGPAQVTKPTQGKGKIKLFFFHIINIEKSIQITQMCTFNITLSLYLGWLREQFINAHYDISITLGRQ